MKKKGAGWRPAWAKLDNTAILFPVIASKEMSNVYRISATLSEEIDGEKLQEALDILLPQFLAFRMRLKMGVFWYYFEENDRKPPRVTEENSYPGAYINKSMNNHYMFRVTYYKKRINLEVFHALTDGYGGLLFLKELIYQYLRLAHREDPAFAGEKDRLSPGLSLDQEDSYSKNFRKPKSADEAYRSKRAVILKGERLPKGQLGVMHGYFPLDQLKAAAKSHQVTINQYLVGLFVYSIYVEYLHKSPTDHPINCCVPVDLRSYYNSNTLRNFFAMVAALFKPEKDDYSLDEVLQIVKDSLKAQITPENLDTILSYNVSNEKNMFLRPIPIFIKNIAIRSVYYGIINGTTATMTNIGNVVLREPYQKYVEHFYAMLNMSRGQDLKGAIVSCNGTLILTFTTRLLDVSIQKRFFRLVAQDGVEVAVETNDVMPDEETENKGVLVKKAGKKEKKKKKSRKRNQHSGQD
ncbi:MAG: hypothetical protein IKR58_02060 [Lachnospiraceae bacterium]|nr:hypothetical protein [Lachnospiraceae bacterium]